MGARHPALLYLAFSTRLPDSRSLRTELRAAVRVPAADVQVDEEVGVVQDELENSYQRVEALAEEDEGSGG